MKFLEKPWPGPLLVAVGLAVISVFWFEPLLQALGLVLAILGLGWSFKRFGPKAFALLVLVSAVYFARAWVARGQEQSAPRRTSDEPYRTLPQAKARIDKVDRQMLVNEKTLDAQAQFCVSVTVLVNPPVPLRRCDLSEAKWTELREQTERPVRFDASLGFRFESELAER